MGLGFDHTLCSSSLELAILPLHRASAHMVQGDKGTNNGGHCEHGNGTDRADRPEHEKTVWSKDAQQKVDGGHEAAVFEDDTLCFARVLAFLGGGQ